MDYGEKLNKVLQQAEDLAGRYSELKSRNQALLNEKNELQTQLDEERKAVEELKNKVKIIKLAKTISGEGSGNTTELKRKINEFTKEIDKCIAMLNN